MDRRIFLQRHPAVMAFAIAIAISLSLLLVRSRGWLEQVDKPEPPLILWNQRWEYDKDPVRLFAALNRLTETGADFGVAICGESFGNVPVEFDEARDRLQAHLVHYGYAEQDEYRRLLLDASVVVSTARHEFFGVAAVEGLAAGAIPIFPNALAYPELIPGEARAQVLYESDAELDSLLGAAVEDSGRRIEIRSLVEPAMQRFSWAAVAPAYDKRIVKN